MKLKDQLLEKSLEELIQDNVLTEGQLEDARSKSISSGKSLGRILVESGYVKEEVLLSYIGRKIDIAPINLKDYNPDPKIISILPENLARKYKIIPLFKTENVVTIAMANPMDIFALDEVKNKIPHDIKPVIADEESIKESLDWYYGKIGLGEANLSLERVDSKTTVSQFVNALLMRAVSIKASDIHIEPREEKSVVRFRIDGLQHGMVSYPKEIHPVIASRIKILADLDVAENRRPQDGSFRMIIHDRKVDFRVSFFPISFGENIVLRVLDRDVQPLDLRKLGFSEETLSEYNKLITRPYGMILVTGPTGCGKTTTLYATLSSINTPEKNIVTLEDPIEYELHGIHQTEINPKAGLTFANGLRSLLRQDPDIIMVGEVRDLETATIAVQAAVTGHLVFTTLHTKDAPGAIVRLLEMGTEPYLIASAIIGVLAQRLIRIVCPHCSIKVKDPGDNEEKFKRGRGCSKCWHTGYIGRTGIFELMSVDSDIISIIQSKTTLKLDKDFVKNKGITTLHQDGLRKVLEGLTTYEELYRITEEESQKKEKPKTGELKEAVKSVLKDIDKEDGTKPATPAEHKDEEAPVQTRPDESGLNEEGKKELKRKLTDWFNRKKGN